MNKIIGRLKLFLGNFGPLVAFYVANHFYGLKLAIITSLLWTLSEVILARTQKRELSDFFKFSAFISIVLGVLDLSLKESLFFKYEAALTNVFTGVYFAMSLRRGKKPLIQEFAEAQGRLKKEPSEDGKTFFHLMTLIWVAYFWIKALVYFVVASHYSLEEGLVIRATFGNLSFYALLFISLFCAHPLYTRLKKVNTKHA